MINKLLALFGLTIIKLSEKEKEPKNPCNSAGFNNLSDKHFIAIFDKSDLSERFKDLNIKDIKLEHFNNYSNKFAHAIIKNYIAIYTHNGDIKILKNRFGYSHVSVILSNVDLGPCIIRD